MPEKELKSCDSYHGNLPLSQVIDSKIRWGLHITSILILLILGMELCSIPSGSASVKDSSSLVFVLDDDDTEFKLGELRDHSFTERDTLSLTGLHMMLGWVKTELILSPEAADDLKMHPGVRRHRWLCRECC